MQKLFSGVAQHTCRCPQCLSGHSGTAMRRFGRKTASSRPNYLVSSTFWMSGIFAAAATFDAGQKIRRQDQWDLAIQEMKTELGLDGTATEKKKAISPVREQEHVLRGSTNTSHTIYRPEVVESHEEKQHSNEDIMIETSECLASVVNTQLNKVTAMDKSLDAKELSSGMAGNNTRLIDPFDSLLHQLTTKEAWPVNTGGPLREEDLAPESIYLRRTLPSHQRSSWSKKKAEIVNLTTNILQLNMLLQIEADYRPWFRDLTPTSVRKLLEYTRHDIVKQQRILLNARYRAWNAKSDLSDYQPAEKFMPLATYDPEQGISTTQWSKMNTQLLNIFSKAKNNKIHGSIETLWDITAILNESEAQPNLQTYNVLIAGFSDCGYEDLTHKAVHALRCCQLRPNETTVATVLQHYIKYDDVTRFDRWVGIVVDGKDGGLALAMRNRGGKDVDTNNRLVRKKGDPEKIIQIQPPSPKVFSAIIAGELQFRGIDAALQKCRLMGLQGWGLCMNSMGPLLRSCVERKEMSLGLQLWSLVCKLEEATKGPAQHKYNPDERIPRHVFAGMLSLCRETGALEKYQEIAAHAEKVWPGQMDVLLTMNNSTKQQIKPEIKHASFKRLQQHEQTVIVDDTNNNTPVNNSNKSGFQADELVTSRESILGEGQVIAAPVRAKHISWRTWQDTRPRLWSEAGRPRLVLHDGDNDEAFLRQHITV